MGTRGGETQDTERQSLTISRVHFKYLAYTDHTILINSDIKTHFRINTEKCAQVLHQTKLNYNCIEVSSDMSVHMLIDLNYTCVK